MGAYAGSRAIGEGVEAAHASLSGVVPRIMDSAVERGPESGFQLSLSQDGALGGGEPSGEVSNVTAPPITRQQTWVDSMPDEGLVPHAPQPASSIRFLRRFGFLMDDLVGADTDAMPSRVRFPVTCLYLAGFLQRCSTAVVFGVFHFHWVSVVQLGLLLALHLAFIIYLLVVRPYISAMLLCSEIIAYGCEVVILIAATILLQHPYSPSLNNTLLTCYYLDICAVMLPDVLHLCYLAWKWWRQRQCCKPGDLQQQLNNPVTERGSNMSLQRQPDDAAAAAASAALRLTSSGGVHR